jgi:adenylate cyclase
MAVVAWKRIAPLVAVLLTGVVVAGMLIGLRSQGWLQFLELGLYDTWLIRQPVDQRADPRIVIIGINEYDIRDATYGGWPKEDGEIADLLNLVGSYEPVVIGLDLFRDLPVPKDGSQRSALNQALLHNHVIGIRKLADAEIPTIPPPQIFADRPDRVGVIDFPIDHDKVLRRTFLYLDDGKTVYYALSFKLAYAFLRTQTGFSIAQDPANPSRIRLGNTWLMPFESNDGGYVGADARGYSLALDFKGPRSFQTYSLIDVMSGKVGRAEFAGKIVLVGAVAGSLKDYYPTLLKVRHYGVELHAMAINQLLRFAVDGDRPMRFWSDAQEHLLILGCCLLGAIVGLSSNAPLRFGLLLGSLLLLLGAGFYLLFRYGWWLPAIPAIFGALGSVMGIGFYMYMAEGRQKRQIRSMFSTMVSPAVLDYMQDRVDRFQLTGEKKSATIFFSDVASFTAISERLPAEALAVALNRYLTPMSDIILAYGGYIDKYTGDGIMANFGVPIWPELEPDSHAWKACWSALDQQARLETIRAELRAEMGIEFHARMGINTGIVSAGNMGSEQKFQYTVMGDTVNQAARFEPANKHFGTRIIIGELTYQLSREKIEARFLGKVVVKGKTTPVNVYELVAKKGDMSAQKTELLTTFDAGCHLFAKRAFVSAIRKFDDCLAMDADDMPSKVYKEASMRYLQEPPAEAWAGEWLLATT